MDKPGMESWWWLYRLTLGTWWLTIVVISMGIIIAFIGARTLLRYSVLNRKELERAKLNLHYAGITLFLMGLMDATASGAMEGRHCYADASFSLALFIVQVIGAFCSKLFIASCAVMVCFIEAWVLSILMKGCANSQLVPSSPSSTPP